MSTHTECGWSSTVLQQGVTAVHKKSWTNTYGPTCRKDDTSSCVLKANSILHSKSSSHIKIRHSENEHNKSSQSWTEYRCLQSLAPVTPLHSRTCTTLKQQVGAEHFPVLNQGCWRNCGTVEHHIITFTGVHLGVEQGRNQEAATQLRRLHPEPRN